MRKITYTNQFKKDYKLAVKRGLDQNKLSSVLNILSSESPLPEKYKDHTLTNSKNYKNVKECHITPDWLLIYKIEENILCLIRTGSHSDLF